MHSFSKGRTNAGRGFELSKKENNDLWKACRRIALEESGDIVYGDESTCINLDIFDYREGFNRNSPFASIGKTYIRMTETPIEMLFDGESLKLFNDGKFKYFKDWKDFTINKFGDLEERGILRTTANLSASCVE